MSTLTETKITATWTIGGKTETATAVTDNRDLVAYDLTRPKRGWPNMDDAPFIANTFVAWSALRRTRQMPTLDEFLENATNVTMGERVEIDPTQAAADAALTLALALATRQPISEIDALDSQAIATLLELLEEQ